MILMAATCIKVLLPLLAGFLFWKQFQNTLSVKCRVGLAALCVLFACIANMAAGYVPPLTDTVTLTALGETGQAGKGQEVFVTGYTVDGETYGPQNAVEGKWFWIGERYGWRPETDRRQPEGTTRSVTLEVPVGWERRVNFSVNEWRGKVEVTGIHGTQQVDTSEMATLLIGRSTTKDLILNQACTLCVYVLSFLIGVGGLFGGLALRFKRPEIFHTLREQHADHCLYFVIAIASFLIMLRYAGVDGFWLDEVYQVQFSNRTGSWKEVLFASTANLPMPLCSLIFYIWYQIMPYGERFLLLLSEVSTVAGLYFIGLCGRKLCGRVGGVMAMIAIVASPTIFVQCAYEFRFYGLYLMGTAIVLLTYLKRLDTQGVESHGSVLRLGIAMLFCAQMHYFGVILCAILFGIDVLLFINHKIKFRCIWSYIIAGLSYLPILIVVVQTKSYSTKATWQGEPSLKAVLNLIRYLSGNSTVVMVLFSVGISAVLIYLFDRLRQKTFSFETDIAYFLPAIIVIVTVAILYLYGQLCPAATLWVERYFVGLIPAVCLLFTYGVDVLVRVLTQRGHKDVRVLTTVICLTITLLIVPVTLDQTIDTVTKIRQPHREGANWLYEQGNYIYNDTTLVVTTNSPIFVEGWSEYYLTKQGQRDEVNVVSQWQLTAEILDGYDRVYLHYVHSSAPQRLLDLLNESFTIVADRPDLKIRTYQRI